MSAELSREEKLLVEEIKILQDIIKRMADNSFKIKAWAITLIVATLLMKTNLNNVAIAFLPLVTFWFLDAYYLQQEKIFRKIYDDKIGLSTESCSDIFKIDTTEYKSKVSNVFFLMFCNKSITPLYLTILILLMLIMSSKTISQISSCFKFCIGA